MSAHTRSAPMIKLGSLDMHLELECIFLVWPYSQSLFRLNDPDLLSSPTMDIVNVLLLSPV
jgi:hypothetical protein